MSYASDYIMSENENCEAVVKYNRAIDLEIDEETSSRLEKGSEVHKLGQKNLKIKIRQGKYQRINIGNSWNFVNYTMNAQEKNKIKRHVGNTI